MLPQFSRVLPATLIAVSFALAIVVSLRLAHTDRVAEHPGHFVSTIWLGNGVQLAALLLLPRRWWAACLGGLLVISIVLMLLSGRLMAESSATSLVNLLEILFAATMLQRDDAWVSGRSDSLASWLRFGGWGVVAAPLAGTAAGMLTLLTFFHAHFSLADTWNRGHTWYITDALAICIIVPVAVRLRPSVLDALERQNRLGALAGTVVLTAVVGGVVMSQPNVIAIFAITIPLIMLVFRQGFTGLVCGMAVLSPLMLGFTRAGHGPFLTMAQGARPEAMLLAQLFLMAMFATVVLIGSLLDERQQLAARESANEQVYRMIAATSSDMILVLTDECAAKYVSPAASELAGRPEHALVGLGWLNQVHTEDRDDLFRAFNAVQDGSRDEGEAMCRLLRREGDWRWLEFRLRRSQAGGSAGTGIGSGIGSGSGAGTGLEWGSSATARLGAVPSVTATAGLTVAIVRDVTGRKEHEETLRAENLQLAHEATTDALTGLANRREFEHRLATEWRRAMSSHQPLSLLMVDIDYFKRYNDTYGHGEGDICLAAVAQALRTTLRRPSDLCARYGGEEFVALLPNTGRAGGHAVALALCAAVRRLQIQHLGNDAGYVTISVGSATAIPEGHASGHLFTQADLALYRAKAGGRDRAEVFSDDSDVTGLEDLSAEVEEQFAAELAAADD